MSFFGGQHSGLGGIPGIGAEYSGNTDMVLGMDDTSIGYDPSDCDMMGNLTQDAMGFVNDLAMLDNEIAALEQVDDNDEIKFDQYEFAGDTIGAEMEEDEIGARGDGRLRKLHARHNRLLTAYQQALANDKQRRAAKLLKRIKRIAARVAKIQTRQQRRVDRKAKRRARKAARRGISPAAAGLAAGAGGLAAGAAGASLLSPSMPGASMPGIPQPLVTTTVLDFQYEGNLASVPLRSTGEGDASNPANENFVVFTFLDGAAATAAETQTAKIKSENIAFAANRLRGVDIKAIAAGVTQHLSFELTQMQPDGSSPALFRPQLGLIAVLSEGRGYGHTRVEGLRDNPIVARNNPIDGEIAVTQYLPVTGEDVVVVFAIQAVVDREYDPTAQNTP